MALSAETGMHQATRSRWLRDARRLAPVSDDARRSAPSPPRRPFVTVEQARHWVERFVAWYNGEHLHSSIRFVTLDDHHRGRYGALLAARHALYQRARHLPCLDSA